MERGDQLRFNLENEEFFAALQNSHVGLSQGWRSASHSFSRTVFYQGAKARARHPVQATQPLGHLKDERLDLDGIWYSAPSPLALPLGCLSCLADTQPAVHSPVQTWGASPWCHQNRVGWRSAKLTGPTLIVSSSELMLRPQGPCLSRPSLLSLPPDSNFLKPVHSFQALQLDLFILVVISAFSSAYKFQGHSMLTPG